MQSTKLLSIIVISLIIGLLSCADNEPIEKQLTLPDTPFDYKSVIDKVGEFRMPSELNVTVLDSEGDFSNINLSTSTIDEDFVISSFNSVESNEVATLGRVLFYDKTLSKNNSIACASCHLQSKAFSDGHASSQGFGGKMTERNAMALANPILNREFFWDSRARTLNDLALRPVFNHIEMGIDNPAELVSKIGQQDYYQELFEDAFGTRTINEARMKRAISEFIASIFSADAKFDEGIDNDFENFSELEKHGMALFFSEKTQCASCHNGRNFASPTTPFNNPYSSSSGTTNIGLDIIYEDQGFAEGKFKIPSLRNIALTAPYMHDGRYQTLEEVIDHYDSGIKPHKDLDPKLKSNGIPIKLNLTDLDKKALVAFLGTLTGKEILTAERYSNPFK